MYGLPFGDSAYGADDISLNIQIGRRQVVKAEVTSHRIQVIRDEGVIMDFPCSYGEADKARNVTRNGVHVVTEKYADFYMSNPAAGYSHVHERWAVRISNNGEFIHANPASAGAQGNTNVTNGCINLSTGDAEQYFQSAIYGDPVEVTGSSIQLSYSDGDIWDWAVDWDTWVAMSALPPPTARPPSTQIPVTAPVTPSTAPTLSGTPTTTTTSSPGLTPAVEPGGRRLVARLHDDQVEVDVGRPRGHEADHLGDVLGNQRRHAGVDGVGALLIAVETNQRELGLHRARRDLGQPHRLAQQLSAQRAVAAPLGVFGGGVSGAPVVNLKCRNRCHCDDQAVTGFDELGQQRRVTRSVPSTLVSHIHRQWSRSVSATGASPRAPPALLTSTSTRLNSSASEATAASSVTSATMAVPPISLARALIRSARRATATT